MAVVLYLLLTYAFLITQCTGQAMFPAIKDGDLCVIFRQQTISLMGEKYEAGDVVTYMVDGKRHFGRVVAIGGDSVQIDTRGSVTVNGVTEGEEILYPTYPRGDSLNITDVNEGTLYVLGDYRTNTEDSRDFGPIPLEDVEGKVISILRRRGL